MFRIHYSVSYHPKFTGIFAWPLDHFATDNTLLCGSRFEIDLKYFSGYQENLEEMFTLCIIVSEEMTMWTLSEHIPVCIYSYGNEHKGCMLN